MKITRVETFTRGNLCLVRITTDDGAQGWGQAAPFNADITMQVVHRQVAPHALGWDPLDPAGFGVHVVEAEYKFPGSYVRRALAGVETAMWDLRGKLEGKPVAALLGGAPKPIAVYGSSMRRDITPEDEAARLVGLRDAEGYRAFKVRIGSVCGHDRDQWPGRTEELVRTVRRAVGPDVTLLADGNSCYTPQRAIEVGRLLEEHRFGHFEEPCPYWELDWTEAVTEALDIPVAGGEQDCFLWQWRRIIDRRVVDIAQPDVCYIGGITRMRKVAEWAARAGLACVPHSANRSLLAVFTLHFLAAIENAIHMELSIEPSAWTDGLFDPAIKVEDGRVAVPDGPGWGVTVNPKWLEQASHRASAM